MENSKNILLKDELYPIFQRIKNSEESLNMYYYIDISEKDEEGICANRKD